MKNKLKKLLYLMWISLGILTITSIFDNDNHRIISNKGRKILNKNN